MSETKLRLSRWRIGWKNRPRKLRLSRTTMPCGCWRLWFGRAFIGHKCRQSSG